MSAAPNNNAQQASHNAPPAGSALEEDDEFEDFPVEGTSHNLSFPMCKFDVRDHYWSQSETVEATQPGASTSASGSQTTGTTAATEHLWEESWDDDDESGDFAVQLREELKKVEGSKR